VKYHRKGDVWDIVFHIVVCLFLIICSITAIICFITELSTIVLCILLNLWWNL